MRQLLPLLFRDVLSACRGDSFSNRTNAHGSHDGLWFSLFFGTGNCSFQSGSLGLYQRQAEQIHGLSVPFLCAAGMLPLPAHPGNPIRSSPLCSGGFLRECRFIAGNPPGRRNQRTGRAKMSPQGGCTGRGRPLRGNHRISTFHSTICPHFHQ